MRIRSSQIGLLLITMSLYAALAYLWFSLGCFDAMIADDRWPRSLPYPDMLLQSAATWFDSLSPPTPSYHAGWNDLEVFLNEFTIVVAFAAGVAFAACWLVLRSRQDQRVTWRNLAICYLVIGVAFSMVNVGQCVEFPGIFHKTPQLPVLWWAFAWPAWVVAMGLVHRLVGSDSDPDTESE